MFARKFLASLACCLFLAWALMGYYPFAFEPYGRNNPSMLASIGFVVQMAAVLVCGLGGLMASVICFYTYTGMQSGGGEATDALTEDRLQIVPWAAPFAILWLGGFMFKFWAKYYEGDMSSVALTIMSIILGFVLLVVVLGTLVHMFPEHKGQRV